MLKVKIKLYRKYFLNLESCFSSYISSLHSLQEFLFFCTIFKFGHSFIIFIFSFSLKLFLFVQKFLSYIDDELLFALALFLSQPCGFWNKKGASYRWGEERKGIRCLQKIKKNSTAWWCCWEGRWENEILYSTCSTKPFRYSPSGW